MNTVDDTFITSGKVNFLRHQKPPLSPAETEKRIKSQNLIRIFFISVIFFAFITGAILLTLMRKYNIDFHRQQAKETTQIFCSMTEHFPACLSSISSPITTSGSGHKWNGPDDIFILSLQLAIEQLNNLTSLTKSLISNSRSDDSKADLKQCEIQIDDSLDRLNRSLTASATVLIFSGRPEDGDNPEIQLQKENLAGEKIDYMMPRVNDSVSDLRNCFQLLVKVDETVGNVDELRGRVHNAMVDAGIAFDFLQNRDEINYRLQYVNMSSGYDRNFWDFTTLLMSFPQYLFLVVLFWLIYRMY